MKLIEKFSELKPIAQIFTFGFIFVFAIYVVLITGLLIFSVIAGDGIKLKAFWIDPDLEVTALRIIEPTIIFPDYVQPEYDDLKDTEKPFFICGYIDGKRWDDIHYYLYKHDNNEDIYPPLYDRKATLPLGYFCLRLDPKSWELDRHIILEEGFENGVENTYLDAEGSGWQVFEDEHGNHFICNMNVDKRELSLSVGEENWENYQLKIDAKDIKFDFSDPAFLHMEVRRKGIATYSFTVNFVSYQNSTSTFTNEASHVYFSKTEMSGEFIRILEKYLEPPIENQWYPVIVNLKDSNITFYWNDEIVIDHNDNQYLSEGSIRISANYGVCLDNIQITAIGSNE